MRTRWQTFKRILRAAVIAVVVSALACLILYGIADVNKQVKGFSLYDAQGEPAYELEETYLWGRLLKMELKRVHGRDMIVCYNMAMVLEPAPRESLGKTSVFERDEQRRLTRAQLELNEEVNCIIDVQYIETNNVLVEKYTGTLADGTLLFELKLDYSESKDGENCQESYVVHHVVGME